MIKHLTLVAALLLSTTNVCAEPELKLTVERLSSLPWAWHSLKIAVRIQNVSNKPISYKPPLIAMRVGDPWTTIDFIAERDGAQLVRRYAGAYAAEFGLKVITLQPGETSEPAIFDLQEDQSNWRRFWTNEKKGNPVDGSNLFPRLPRGRYTVRVKFFNPVDTKKTEANVWRGEITSEPFRITII